MKKKAIALIMVVMLISLCSCVYDFNYEDLIKNVQTVEIIEYNADTTDEVVIKTISEADKEQILLDLSHLRYYYQLGAPEYPEGKCLKLIYKNGNYDILSWKGTTINQLLECNKESFYELLQKYLDK